MIIGCLPGIFFFCYLGTLITDLSDINTVTSRNSKQNIALTVVIGCFVCVTLVVITSVARRSWRETVRRMALLDAKDILKAQQVKRRLSSFRTMSKIKSGEILKSMIEEEKVETEKPVIDPNLIAVFKSVESPPKNENSHKENSFPKNTLDEESAESTLSRNILYSNN